MPAPTVDPTLARLRTEWQSKNDEAAGIIGNSSATGEMLVKAEKLFNERDATGEQIKDREATLQRLDGLKGRYDSGNAWASEPQRGLPFAGAQIGNKSYGATADRYADAGAGHFSLTGMTPAGHNTMAYDKQKQLYEMIAEAGPGTMGQKTWDTISSFEYKRDFVMYLRKGIRYLDLCTKTLQEGLDDQGGVFSPAELLARVIGRLPAPTQLRSLVTTLTTGRDTLILPRKQYAADDQYTTAFRLTWTGEIPSDGTGDIERVNDANLLGNIDIPVHTGMLTAPVTRNLIEDSAFPIQAWLESELAQVIDLVYEDSIINGSTLVATSMGSQSNQPIGFLFGAATGNVESNTLPECILSQTAGGLDYNSLVNTQMALAPQYESESTVWIMQKRSTYSAINQIKDSQQRPLFTTGYSDSGMVERRGRVLLGDRIILSQFMPAISPTSFPVFYGDLKGYYVAQRVGFSIQVLDQTKAKANQIELVGRIRFGGRPIEPFRMKLLKSNSS